MSKKKHLLYFTLVFLLFMAGCISINRQQTIPTDTFSRTPSYSSTLNSTPSTPTDLSPKMAATSTPVPTMTEMASTNDIIWAEGLKLVFSSPYFKTYATHRNLWSPTSNEILLDCHEGRTQIITLGAFNFVTADLANDSGCWDAAWSPDGLSVAYVDKMNDIQIEKSKTGELIRANTIRGLRTPIYLSWMDSQNLVYGDYTGGGHVNFHVVDIRSGKDYDIAQVPGGELGTPFSSYLPITFETFPLEKHVLMISKRIPESNVPVPQYMASGKYLPFPTYDAIQNEQALSEFNGWLPNSNQALIAWRYIGIAGNIINKETLMLWDVDIDQVIVLIPDAIQGQISWDGRYLAYLTRGSAALSENRTPIEKSGLYPIKPDDLLHDNPIYLQLFDMTRKRVVFSIASDNMNFSPKGHYLAFVTRGDVQIDDEGISNADQSTGELSDYLNVFDLVTLKLTRSLKDTPTLPIWSPASDHFLYEDIKGNVNLYDMKGAKTMPITLNIGEYKVKQMEWSFDGHYFYLLLSDESEKYDRLVVIKNPLKQ